MVILPNWIFIGFFLKVPLKILDGYLLAPDVNNKDIT